MANLANHLISEILGINTTMRPQLTSSVAGFYAVCGCERPEEIFNAGCGRRFSETHAVFEMWASTVDYVRGDFEAEFGDLVAESLGSLGYQGREGIFVPSGPMQAAIQTEGLPLEFYKSYNLSWQNPKQYFDSISSVDESGLLQCSQSFFSRSVLMDKYLEFSGDTDGVETIDGAFVAKCLGGLEGNWWLAPACRDDPETCIPVITSGESWYMEHTMVRAANYGMPLALAVSERSKWMAEPYSTRLLFYWFYPDTAFADLYPRAIVFPAHDPIAHAEGDVSTDTKTVALEKYVHAGVARAASRAHELIQNMQISLADLEPLLVEAKLNASKTGADLACEWLLDNREIWQAWVPFETKCSPGWGLVDVLGGYVGNRSLATSCDWCPPGYFSEKISDDFGATHTCRACAEGMHQAMPGQTACFNCSAGHFAAEVGKSRCEACAPGTSNGVEGQSACIGCEPGSFQSSAGAPSCEPCAGGTFIGMPGSTACDLCPSGMFSEESAIECSNCSAGSAAAEEGSSSCIECSLGHVAPGVGASECTACPIGEYSNERGRSACERCGGGEPLWTTMRKLDVQGSQQWVRTDAAKSEEKCGCDVGARFDVDGKCVECDVEGIDCPGMGEVLILRGFYSAESPLSLYKCGSPLKCVGGKPGFTCADGRVGLSCANCKAGTTPGSSGVCVPCSGGDKTPFALLVMFAIIVLTLLYASLDRTNGTEPGYMVMLIGISGGLFVGLMQQLSVVGLMDINYAEPLHSFLSVVKIFAFDIEDVIRLNCIGSIPALAHFTTKVCMIIGSAVVLLLVHVLFVLIKHRGRFRKQNPILIAVFGTIVMIFYISVTVTILQPLQCSSNPNGKWTVQAYEDVVCWDAEEDEDHVVMLCVGLLALTMPVSLFVKVILLVRRLPAALRRSNIDFIRSYGFLFFRFRPQAHWYILVIMTRSLIIGIVPIIPERVMQIYTLQIVLLATLVMVVHYKPWRVVGMNWLDAIFGFAIISFLNISAFAVTDASVEALGWFCVCIVCFCIGLVPAFLLLAAWKKVAHSAKPFQFFLCHCKADAGAFARWLKMELVASEGLKRDVFLDSDNLESLDLLLSYVAADVETLVVIASQAVFYRPWCVGEMTTAHINKINAAVLALPDYTRMEEDTIANFDAEVPEVEVLCVDCGMRLDSIKDAIRTFSEKEVIRWPLSATESCMTELGRLMVSRRYCGEINVEPDAPLGLLHIAIICDENLEAVAIAQVLLKLLVPRTCHDVTSIPKVLEPHKHEAIPTSVTKVIFLCTQGCFGSRNFVDRVLEVGDRSLSTLPVIGDDEFRVPKADAFDMLSPESLRPAPDGEERAVAEVGLVVSEIFKQIAIPLRAKHERISMLEAAGDRVAKRLLGASGSRPHMKPHLSARMEVARGDGELVSHTTQSENPWNSFESGFPFEEEEDGDFTVDDEATLRSPSVTCYKSPSRSSDDRMRLARGQSFASLMLAGLDGGDWLDTSRRTAAQRRYATEKRSPSFTSS